MIPISIICLVLIGVASYFCIKARKRRQFSLIEKKVSQAGVKGEPSLGRNQDGEILVAVSSAGSNQEQLVKNAEDVQKL